MRFLHAADLHLKEYTWKHCRDVQGDALYALEQLSAIAIQEKVDAFFICGDALNTPYPSDDVIFWCQHYLKGMTDAGIRVVCNYGNHDRTKHHGWMCLPGVPVTHLNGESLVIKGVETYGFDYVNPTDLAAAFINIPSTADIVMIHQMEAGAAGGLYESDFTLEDFPGRPDGKPRYVAAGDYHGRFSAHDKDHNIYLRYPGPPYMTRISEIGSRAAMIVDMESGGVPKIKEIPLKCRPVFQLSVSTQDEMDELCPEIQKKITAHQLECPSTSPIFTPVVVVRYVPFSGARSFLEQVFESSYLRLIPQATRLETNPVPVEDTGDEVLLDEAIKAVMGDRFDADVARFVRELVESEDPPEAIEAWARSTGAE